MKPVTTMLPDPPYPTTTKVNGWRPTIDMDRILQSKTWLLADTEVRPWLVMLWLFSWRSIPAGSYEDDDELIASIIGCGISFFNGHRSQLMRGWIKHTDGRLYHPYITEMVLEMIEGRRFGAKRQAKYRREQEKMRERGDASVTRCHVSVTPRNAADSNRTVNNVKDKTEFPRKRENAKTRKTNYSVNFDRFWFAYPQPRRKEKPKAWAAWKAQGCEPLTDRIIEKLERQKTGDRQFLDGYEPYPERYIKNRKWEDEIDTRQPNGNRKHATAAEARQAHEARKPENQSNGRLFDESGREITE